MHMADALISPAVGGVMFAVSAVGIGYAVKQTAKDTLDEKKIPMMGVMGAFIFAAQMINFTIPGTGSSGHIGGGILLAALLGPYPALITLSSVLLIQCLFFADGGLLALGCNIFNLGILVCIFAHNLIFKPILKKGINKKRIVTASILSVTIGLQAGAFFVVVQTMLSGITELPFGAFLLLMQPIHLAIGLAEGIVTAAVLCYVHSARPELLDSVTENAPIPAKVSVKRTVAVFALLAVITGGVLSLFASGNPDGLEWSIERVAGVFHFEREGIAHTTASSLVESTAFMPDYSFANEEDGSMVGTSAAGLIGGTITLLLSLGTGMTVRAIAIRKKKEKA